MLLKEKVYENKRFNMRKKFIWSILGILYVAFVLYNSLRPGAVSSAQSSFVLEQALNVMDAVGMGDLVVTEHIIRKTAHFVEYMVMGILLYQVLGLFNFQKMVRRLLYAIFGFFVPFVDETIQLFVEGRSGQISDVWLNYSGVAFGMMVAGGINWLIWKRKGRGVRIEEKL